MPTELTFDNSQGFSMDKTDYRCVLWDSRMDLERHLEIYNSRKETDCITKSELELSIFYYW